MKNLIHFYCITLKWVRYFYHCSAKHISRQLHYGSSLQYIQLFSFHSVSRDCIHATFLKDNKFSDFVPIGNAFNFSKWLFSAIYAVLCSSFPLIWIDIGPVSLFPDSNYVPLLTMGIADSLFRWFFPIFDSDYEWNSQINRFRFPPCERKYVRIIIFLSRILCATDRLFRCGIYRANH